MQRSQAVVCRYRRQPRSTALRRWASVITAAALTALLASGCGVQASQSGPLAFGLDELHDPENSMCGPRSHLAEGFYLGDIATNPTDHDLILIRLELVNPKGVTAVGTGAQDNTGNTMVLYGGSEDMKAELLADESDRPANARTRWPEITPQDLNYVLSPGKQAQVMIEIHPDRDSGRVSVDRLRLTYESQGRTYQEVSNVAFYFNANQVSDCPAD
jgi:hypothetical protein